MTLLREKNHFLLSHLPELLHTPPNQPKRKEDEQMDLALIGQRIKRAREAAGITQEELAQAVGCTAKHIGAIERGIKTPRIDTFIVIANTVGASADLLLQDLLNCPVDSLAGELAAAVAPLTPELQQRVLKALRAFSESIN